MANGEIKQISEAVDDALTFPILTKEVNGHGSRDLDSSRGSVSSGSSLGRLARDTIRNVLGWRYRTEDTKGFTAALTKAFDLKVVEGHTEWDFKPQNYTVQADLGEITGAQASIYARAKVAADHALPLLNGLTSLREDADDEDVEAMRAIVRTEMSELVQELGKVGGPRVQRIESFFTLLIGSAPDTSDPEKVSGQLAELRDRFGLERKRVNTIGEEQNLTNFLIVVDYVNSLYITWRAQSKFLDRRGTVEPFLGTQLVLLSQTLDVIAESVQESYDAMDSVFFGASERDATYLTLNGESPISVSELLGWVETFATNEGRQLIQDGGKDGVVAFRSTLQRLDNLIDLASKKSREASGNPTRGFHCARVQRSFEETRVHLTTGLNLIEKIKSPDQTPTERTVISDWNPKKHAPANVEITITGEHLNQVEKVWLKDEDLVHPPLSGQVTPRDEHRVTVKFNLSNANTGWYSLILEDDGGQRITSDRAFEITAPPPGITQIEPRISEQEEVVRLRVSGKDFQEGLKVVLQAAGTKVTHAGAVISPVSATELTAVFDLSYVLEGDWEVIVTNPDGQRSAAKKFQVVLPPSVIESFTPVFSHPGETFDLVIRGRYFPIGLKPRVFLQAVLKKGANPTIIEGKVTPVSTKEIRAQISLKKGTPGPWHVAIQYPNEPAIWGPKALQVWPNLDALVDDYGDKVLKKLKSVTDPITNALQTLAKAQSSTPTRQKTSPKRPTKAKK